LDQGKGQEELVYAAGEVLEEFPRCKFLMVGEETKGERKGFLNKIQALIERLHIGNNVKVVGFRTDVAEILKALDIFVLPSYKEAFGISLLEAMAMRVPIVATNSGGVPEILDYGDCAILVPPQEAKSLAEGIKKYLRDPDLAQKKALCARQKVEREYDLNLVLDKIQDLYLKSSDHLSNSASGRIQFI
jgi:glycosyltransferase involved in cell wall biosynthesis